MAWSFSRKNSAETSPNQKKQRAFLVDPHPEHCFFVPAPQCPWFSSCTVTLVFLLMVLSHTPCENERAAQAHTTPLAEWHFKEVHVVTQVIFIKL